MATIGEMEAILKQNSNDPETLAGFYEAAARQCPAHSEWWNRWFEKARQERLRIFNKLWEEKNHKGAINYAKAHHLLYETELLRYVREWCEEVLEKRPWEALDVAREYNLVDLELEAAVKRSEGIIAHPGSDVGPALDIARKERAADEDYRRRAARHAFQGYIRSCCFSSLPSLVTEFRLYFSLEEVELADFLARAQKERDEAKWGAARAKAGLRVDVGP